MDPVLVAGGGIGGLGAALALARAGYPVRLFERSAEFRELGAGIQLGPNVFHMFDRLGLRVPAIAVSAYSRAGTISHDEMHHGSVIATLS